MVEGLRSVAALLGSVPALLESRSQVVVIWVAWRRKLDTRANGRSWG